MLDVSLETHLNAFHLKVAFQAQSGQTAVVLGESGAGKSTVLRLLAGLLQPQQGHITLDDVTYYDSAQKISSPPQQRPFGYVFQDYVLFPHLTVFDNVAFGLRAQHLSRPLISKQVTNALERVQMHGYEKRLPAQLSGGQQQRIAIARALALQPRLLLLDEPLSALDIQTRRAVRQELRTILQQTGITTMLVTHNYLDGLLFGNQILVMDQGQLLQQGDQQELRQYPRSSYVAELIGVNFFHGSLRQQTNNQICTIRLDDQQHTAQALEISAVLKEQEENSSRQPVPGQEVFVIVDPRSITLHQHVPEGSARNIFQGTILTVLPIGATTGQQNGRLRVSMQISQTDAPLTAEITEESARKMELHEGKAIFATFKATEASAYL